MTRPKSNPPRIRRFPNWLPNQTWPDNSTITNIIFQYNNNCSPGHINDSAKYTICYLKGTAKVLNSQAEIMPPSNHSWNFLSTHLCLLLSQMPIETLKINLFPSLVIHLLNWTLINLVPLQAMSWYRSLALWIGPTNVKHITLAAPAKPKSAL